MFKGSSLMFLKPGENTLPRDDVQHIKAR
ncbi:hypothetical protein EPYR_01520 [Erwinia pyrifoliae DSM 12163]|nr:hypothetical protein EPYR_01520 [Erwinia pyrifoliae DSM 12163]